MAKKENDYGSVLLAAIVAIVAIAAANYFTHDSLVSVYIGGIVALVIALSKSASEKLSLKQDKMRTMVGAFGVILLVLAYAAPVMITSTLSPLGLQAASVVGTGSQQQNVNQPQPNQQQGQQIITTTVNFDVLAKNLLNKTDDSLNPSGYYYSNGAYQTLSFSSGKATISTLLPTVTIDKIAVGTDGTFYWAQQTGLKAINQQTTFNLVRVFTSWTFTASSYGDSSVAKYADVTNGTANISTGTGGIMKFYIRFTPTSQFTGIRHPIYVFNVNTSAVQDIVMPGLNALQSAPTGILSADQGARTTFKAFDSGFDWMVDTSSKPIGTAISTSPAIYQDPAAGKILYGGTDQEVDVTYKAAFDPPTATDSETCSSTGTYRAAVHVYVFDQDEYYRSTPGTLYFLDPALSSTNLGSTSQPDLFVCPK